MHPNTPYYLDWIVYEKLILLKFSDTVTTESLPAINTHLMAYLDKCRNAQINLIFDTGAVTSWQLTARDVSNYLPALYHIKVRWLLLTGSTAKHIALSLRAVCNTHQIRFQNVEQISEALEFLKEESWARAVKTFA